MNLFKRTKYLTVGNEESKDINANAEEVPTIPDGMWIKCDKCNKILYNKEVEENLKVCPECGGYFRLNAKERIDMIVDDGTFKEFNENMTSKNPLDYPGYEEKIKKMQEKTGLSEGVVTGYGEIEKKPCIIAVMDSNFMMGSMGSVVGEKITFAVEKATKEKLPIIIFTCSGGARMQEGMVSLMQMAKVSAALGKHSDEGLLYVTVLTDPTTGGVTASFAMLGDIILAEPKALVGFAGRRVIESTINEKLPDNFQRAEFLLEKGFIDLIVDRRNLREKLYKILAMHEVKAYE